MPPCEMPWPATPKPVAAPERPWRRCSGQVAPAAGRASASTGPASHLQEKLVRRPGHRRCSRCRSWWCTCAWQRCMRAGRCRSRCCWWCRSGCHRRHCRRRSLRGLSNDVFFKVGLITIIGLSAKNAILIIEFAKSLYDEGHDLLDATVQAARPALPPDHHDLPGVYPRGGAAGDCHRCQFGEPAGHRHRGDRRDDHGDAQAVVFVPVFFVVVMKLAKGRRQDR